MPDTRGGPAAGAPGPAGAQAGVGPQAPNGAQAQGGPTPLDQTPPKKPTPVYKKWWFWAVVAVSAYVVYSIATEGSNSQARTFTTGPVPQQDTGLTLMRF